MANKKVQVQLLDENTGAFIEDVDVLTAADCVKFNDGKTFQQKLDEGTLRGQTGAQGAKGQDGAKGDTWKPTVDSSGNLSWTINNTPTQPSTINIKGPKGQDGAAGADGSKMHNVTGVPATSLGAIGDWALNTTNGDVYEKTASTVWTKRGNFKGAQGERGVQGATGAKGADGAKGATGTSLRPKGAWSGSVAYIKDANYIDIVTHQGSTYACKQSNTGQVVTNATYWELIAQKGATGAKGEKGDLGDTVKVGTSTSSATPRKLFFKVVG